MYESRTGGSSWALRFLTAENIGRKALLTLCEVTVTIKCSAAILPHRRPRRLAWPRTSPFHGGNTGSNPVGDASFINHLQIPSRIL